MNRRTNSLLNHDAKEAHKAVLLLLISHHTLLVLLDVNNSRLELPGRNLAIEQDVHFTVRAVLELRKEEESHDPADASGSSPDVTALACQVPSGRVEHLRGEVDHGNFGDVVGGTTDTGA